MLDSRRDSRRRREALEQLCATYWPPIYGYLRRRGHSRADAEDLTQGFLLHVVESDFLERPDPGRGRFRGYLVGALRHYLASHFEKAGAERRGGRATFLHGSEAEAERDFEALGPSVADPAELFDAAWAIRLLGGALRDLEREQAAAGKARQFEVLRPFLGAAPSHGDYERVAALLGTRRTTVAVWVHRLNQRYGELVRLAVAATVGDPAEVDGELRHLLAALGRGPGQTPA